MTDHHQLQAAARDMRLRGLDLRVLLVLQGWLEHELPRWVKVATIANDLYLDPTRPSWSTPAQRAGVARSLGRLRVLGYLRPGPKDGARGTLTLATPPRMVERRGTDRRRRVSGAEGMAA